jgi:phage tail protein X
MGSVYAEGLSEIGLSLEEQILVHLTSNHYPPVPKVMVEPCIEAIDNANSGEWEKEVPLPEGVLWKGQDTAPTDAMVEQHHLEFWIIESELEND